MRGTHEVEAPGRQVGLLAHRGLWARADDRNSLGACTAALEAGFGIEIDIRDRGGEVVVAHDVDEPTAWPLDLLLPRLARFPDAWVALNVKSCGLAGHLAPLLALPTPWFVFDAAVPDLLAYIAAGFPAFTRQSEYEADPSCLEGCRGVWLDAFHHDWATDDVLLGHLRAGRHVAVVSPELHGRPHEVVWARVRRAAAAAEAGPAALLLCTDHPAKARTWFGDA